MATVPRMTQMTAHDLLARHRNAWYDIIMNERQNIIRRVFKRRHRPGEIEVTTVDSLEVGDWIAEHRHGLQFNEFTSVTSSRTWVCVEELDRMMNGDVRIGFFNPKNRRTHGRYRQNDFVDCLPETLVKRRMEAES